MCGMNSNSGAGKTLIVRWMNSNSLWDEVKQQWMNSNNGGMNLNSGVGKNQLMDPLKTKV